MRSKMVLRKLMQTCLVGFEPKNNVICQDFKIDARVTIKFYYLKNFFFIFWNIWTRGSCAFCITLGSYNSRIMCNQGK